MNDLKDENLRLRLLILDIYDLVTNSARGSPNFVGDDVAEMIEISGVIGLGRRRGQ